MERKHTFVYGIKGKLVSAVAMLLVAVIMVVSSTYAWFTLSTAPEVTGISTNIGANGALEMALYTGLDKVLNYDPSLNKTETEKNAYWGNLVTLADNDTYGMNKIVLYPAQLNLTSEGKINFGSIVKVPKYGADGRVSELSADAVTGTYDYEGEKVFIPNAEYGLRAVGVASGMTPRQSAYRNARAAAATARSQAKTLASQSLNANGNALANIALAHNVNPDATHTQADVEALLKIVDDLLGTDPDTTDGVLEYIEEAYRQYILAYAASAVTTTDDTVYNAVKSMVDADYSLSTMVQALSGQGITLPTAVSNGIAYLIGGTVTIVTVTEVEGQDPTESTSTITVYATVDAVPEGAQSPVVSTKGNVTKAKDELTALKTAGSDTIAWSEITTSLHRLADVGAMKINGFAASSVKENMSAIVNGVAGNGLTVTIATGGGVYADIADHCGDFNASVVIKQVEYNGLVLNNMNARMETATTVDPVYIEVMNALVANAGSPAAGNGATTMPITEFYGYIIDLAFRTNAAESSLLLQTSPKDRIYEGNTNEETMGHGSSMEFTATDTSWTADDVIYLMNSVRVVFFDTTDGTILGTAVLDTSDVETVGGNTVTANLYLQKEGQIVKDQAEAKIIDLTQNQEHHVSALVYFDGEAIENAHVAATVATSVTGSLNLQFSSSAELVPMDYADLNIKEPAEND